MRKLIARIVAIFLVPCLIADSSFAGIFVIDRPSSNPFRQRFARLDEEAIPPRPLAENQTITGVAVGQVDLSFGRLKSISRNPLHNSTGSVSPILENRPNEDLPTRSAADLHSKKKAAPKPKENTFLVRQLRIALHEQSIAADGLQGRFLKFPVL